jgi:hypothetical protein
MIGIITILIYSIVCYLYCSFKVGKRLNLKIESGRQVYKDVFGLLWVTILVLGFALNILGKMVLYILGRLM